MKWRGRDVMATVVVMAIASADASAQPWVEREQVRKLERENDTAGALEMYERMARENPFDGSVWSRYGFCLHGAKKYAQAIDAYAKAIELGYQRNSNLYNTACALALQGKQDEAFKYLEQALDARMADQETLESDTDMDSLRSDPRFAALTGITKGLQKPLAATREEGWAWDLDFYARRMKQMHWDLYANVTKEAFLDEIEKLKKQLKDLDDSQVRAKLRRITAMVGDGHTSSRLNAEGEPRLTLPLHMFTFTDGLYIIGADEANAGLVGAQVLKIGGIDVDAAVKAVRPYTHVDNEMGYLAWGPGMLASPIMLREIGAATDTSGAEFTVKKLDGKTQTVQVNTVQAPPGGHGGFLMHGYKYLHDSAESVGRPLYLRDTSKVLRTELIPEKKTLYFWFGGVTDAPDKSFADFTQEMFDLLDKNGVENLVIDMRFNGGGNTGLIRPLVYGLMANKTINQRGHLWVLIGRNTFSAAQNTVNFIERNTQATFVGEPTGSRPQFVGESTWFVLPHSRTRVFCSSRYWQQMDSTDERTWVQPQIAAQMSFADYAAGRDPAMEAVMRWVGSRAVGVK